MPRSAAAAVQLGILLLLLVAPACLARPIQDTREDSLIGYRETGAAAGGRGGGRTGTYVDLHTQFGVLSIKLYGNDDIAPRTAQLVWDLARRRGCKDCAFYRNEAKPRNGKYPPYALLQGRLDIADVAPADEGKVVVAAGHVAFVPGTKDFFVSYGDHAEWGTNHTVFGQVVDWLAADMIITQRYRTVQDPKTGTPVRLLLDEVPIKISVKGDTTYPSTIGPLKD